MKIVSMLESKTKKDIYLDPSDNIQIQKTSSGVYNIVDLKSGETINPANSNKFMQYMPEMKESKCKDYGSDD
ncbi:MAG: hypothetical protein M1470_12150 [Bacteroidetes bacterium]|nr:hypothetical protein [Bacteroidota bacterium]MCL5737167.1 hypothetical protein [Bacteroidota bacterium]